MFTLWFPPPCQVNAGIVRDLAQACAQYCPTAFILVISNPVNSTVPIVCEVFKKAKVFDPRRLVSCGHACTLLNQSCHDEHPIYIFFILLTNSLSVELFDLIFFFLSTLHRVFGVTTLDVVRSSTFVHQIKPQFEPHSNRITVVGGHSGATIVPVLSQIKQVRFSDEEIKSLTHRIQYGGDEVVKAKDGAGSATLSMAYAGARFTNSLLEASVRGKRGLVESTYVHLIGNPGAEWNVKATGGLEYFAQDVELGPQGVAQVKALPDLSAEEKKLVAIAIGELKGNIAKGVSFITEGGAVPTAKL